MCSVPFISRVNFLWSFAFRLACKGLGDEESMHFALVRSLKVSQFCLLSRLVQVEMNRKILE